MKSWRFGIALGSFMQMEFPFTLHSGFSARIAQAKKVTPKGLEGNFLLKVLHLKNPRSIMSNSQPQSGMNEISLFD